MKKVGDMMKRACPADVVRTTGSTGPCIKTVDALGSVQGSTFGGGSAITIYFPTTTCTVIRKIHAGGPDHGKPVAAAAAAGPQVVLTCAEAALTKFGAGATTRKNPDNNAFNFPMHVRTAAGMFSNTITKTSKGG